MYLEFQTTDVVENISIIAPTNQDYEADYRSMNKVYTYLDTIDVNVIATLKHHPQLLDDLLQDSIPIEVYFAVIDTFEINPDVVDTIEDKDETLENYSILDLIIVRYSGLVDWPSILERGYHFSNATLLYMAIYNMKDGFAYTLTQYDIQCNLLEYALKQYILRMYITDLLYGTRQIDIETLERHKIFELADDPNIEDHDYYLDPDIFLKNQLYLSETLDWLEIHPESNEFKDILEHEWRIKCFRYPKAIL